MRAFLISIVFLALGGCATGGTLAPEAPPAPTVNETPQALIIETPPVVEERVQLVPQVTALEGLNPKQVQAKLGEPSFVRRDANVQVMLFETKTCVFEVIFFEPTPGEHFTAAKINARTRKGVQTDVQQCLGHIIPGGAWLDGTQTIVAAAN
ncbi:MAG: hypothetical protein COB37_01855 [Kordiimonadales bacterium]|nr:MAG: hypothetical protein COB37_01855 [Kordiimonadales bacterium]